MEDEDFELDHFSKMKNNKDEQYKDLLSNIKKKQSRNIKLDKKYVGKKVSKKQLQNEQSSDEEFQQKQDFDEEDFEGEESSNDEQKYLNEQEEESDDHSEEKQMKKNKKQNKKDNIDIEKYLDEIEEEDVELVKKQENDDEKELEKGEHVNNQLQIFKMALHLRMEIKKMQDIAKKLPLEKNIGQFREVKGVKEEQKGLALGIVKLIEDMVKVENTFVRKTGQKVDMDVEWVEGAVEGAGHVDYLEEQVDSRAIVDHLQLKAQRVTKWEEDVIGGWSQKTAILQNNLKKGGFTHLMQTPVGQTHKAMEQLEQLVLKTQLKGEHFRILGEPLSELGQLTNPNIYEDKVFYQELVKDLVEQDEYQGDHLWGNTLKHLAVKRVRNAEAILKPQVDRKATKHRKLHFNLMPKLLNYMSTQSIPLLDNRQQILSQIINSHSSIPPVHKKIKKHTSTQPDDTIII